MRRALLILALICIPVAGLAQSGKPIQQRGYLHPQFVEDTNGNVGMLWVRPSGSGHDLFLARRAANGSLVDPVQVNSTAGDVLYVAHREGRPGLAAGPGGRGKGRFALDQVSGQAAGSSPICTISLPVLLPLKRRSSASGAFSRPWTMS